MMGGFLYDYLFSLIMKIVNLYDFFYLLNKNLRKEKSI